MHHSYEHSARSGLSIAALFGLLIAGLTHADTLHLTDDTFTNPSSTIIKGDLLEVRVRDVASEKRGYAKFNISTLSSSTVAADVDSATLRFWVKDVIVGGTIELYLVNGAWDEQTLTASIAPPIGSAPFASVSVLSEDEGSFVSVDVTPAVTSWLSANNGLALVASGGARIDIDSKETEPAATELEQTSNAMEIEVALIGPEGPQGPQGVAGNDGAVGSQGIPGNDGAGGATGPQGLQGTQGIAGNDGADGAGGPPGPQGPEGPQGPQGTSGSQIPNICPHGDTIAYDTNPNAWVCSSHLTPPQPYNVGDTGPAGGIVFAVSNGGISGLEISPVELGPFQFGWGCRGTLIDGANNEAIGSGQDNTNAILAGCTLEGTPAKRADEYSLNGFDDWFLPSNLELYQYYQNQTSLPSLPYNLYWASTQINAQSARTVDWLNGNPYGWIAKDTISIAPFGTIGARAVRAF